VGDPTRRDDRCSCRGHHWRRSDVHRGGCGALAIAQAVGEVALLASALAACCCVAGIDAEVARATVLLTEERR
jgi:hypothetical protein